MLVSVIASAQSSTSSPYSLSGLGELKYGGFTQHTATGGTSISQQNENTFSPSNPASLASLRFTVYDVGAKMSLGKLSTSTLEANTRSGNFSHFAMAFPFETKRKMAVSFGTNQYSDVGYEINNRVNTDTPSYYNLFRGNGGINRVFLGYGIEAFKNFNIGASANYNFGSIQALEAKVYPNSSNYFSFSDETYYNYKGFDFDLGVQYSVLDTVHSKKNTSGIIKHTIGAAFHTNASLRGTGYRYAETFIGPQYDKGILVPIDTLLFNDNLRDTVGKPAGIVIGYTISNGKQWSVSLELEQNLWSTITDKRTNTKFFDNTRYSAGFSIIPSPKYDEKGDWLKKVRYSAGIRYENLYYNFGTEPLKELGISFGLGLPIVKSVRIEGEKVAVVSMINITAEYVKRGTTNNGLIQEDYINIGLGLNLNDKWFTKRKYH
ncbi:MAG: hypothetical protein COA58_09710 [Bacteroidetes bacterium]|nr:MAG: hypothetical protein COA58_09710 [Bacteroidota bacterium]